jgi:hypothetical protein
MYPKEFIQHVLINEIGDIAKTHPYLSFTLIAIGIEFLGKCLSDGQDWHKINSNRAFERDLALLAKEEPIYSQLNLRNELRNGFAHGLLPKSKLALSEVKNGDQHFSEKDGKTVLVAEIFYRDFVVACKRILDQGFKAQDKMNIQLLKI